MFTCKYCKKWLKTTLQSKIWIPKSS